MPKSQIGQLALNDPAFLTQVDAGRNFRRRRAVGHAPTWNSSFVPAPSPRKAARNQWIRAGNGRALLAGDANCKTFVQRKKTILDHGDQKNHDLTDLLDGAQHVAGLAVDLAQA